MHENNVPLIRLTKRAVMPAKKVWAIRIASFVVAILLGGVLFLCLGHNPAEAYGTILSGSLGKATAIRQTVKIAIPLLGTALALAPCFKMKYWNIGAEG
ncbi:MAG: ABC transporter permease, partial [Oscillospiraceae bacterium]|nr:ABC transporter permease [Oscillospiraceae bacterium]